MTKKVKTTRRKRTPAQNPVEKLLEIETELEQVRKTPWNKRTSAQIRRVATLVTYRGRLQKRIETGEWDYVERRRG